MLVAVQSSKVLAVVDEIITFITAEQDKINRKTLADIKEKYSRETKRWFGFVTIPGREIDDDEAKDIAKAIAREEWRVWYSTKWDTWLARSRNLRKGCIEAAKNGNGMITLQLEDIQLLRWHDDDWDADKDTYGE